MRFLSRLCAVLAWIFFIFTLFVHGIIVLSMTLPPFFRDAVGGREPVENPVNAAALPFLFVGIAVFAAGFLLCRFLRRGHWIWFAAAAAGALLLAGVGLYLKVQYPETILTGGVTAGYDSLFKLVWRHMVPLLVAVLELLSGVFRSVAEGREMRREAVEETSDYKPRFE